MQLSEEPGMDSSALLHEEAGLGLGRYLKAFTRHFTKPCTVRLHYHDSLELNLCEHTIGRARIDGYDYDLSQASLIVIPPACLHSYDIAPSSGTMLVVHIALHHLSDWLGQKGLLTLLDQLPNVDENWAEGAEKLYRLVDEYQKSEVGTELDSKSMLISSDACLLSSRILELVSCLKRTNSASKAIPTKLTQLKGNDTAELRHLVDYARARLATKLRIEAAAKEMGMSRARFCRWFKEKAGVSFGTYFEELRLENARRRLESGSSLSLAAEASGYEDLSYFVKRFKKRYGNTPGVWLRQQRAHLL